MPWRISTAMSERFEFVMLASQENANIRALCRRFGISSRTAYKWLARYELEGAAGLGDRSRRPHHSPMQTPLKMTKRVVALRRQYPEWGGRKLEQRLLDLGHHSPPSPSTITAILRRHQLLDPQESSKHKAFQRFERAVPNELWQMDFKGDFAVRHGRCYPLTVLDDHSRFVVGLHACADNATDTTQMALVPVFRRYGLPAEITCDNGPPWGSAFRGFYTRFGVWLLRLGIRVRHSRPGHPQTKGKDERFHRTLAVELLRDQLWSSFAECQTAFDEWRQQYNLIRPHEALGQLVPASRYQSSHRPFPETLPAIEYDQHEIVRKVGLRGQIKYQNRKIFIGNAFARLHIALRPTAIDGVLDIYLCYQRLGSVNLNQLPKDD